MPARDVGKIVADKQVESVCPYCGVGCQLTYNVKDNKILFVQGKDGPANSSRLCVKGRYGFDYVQHKHRLTKPLIRKPGVAEAQGLHRRSRQLERRLPRSHLGRSARVRRRAVCATIRDTYGKRSLAGFGSAKGTNEEAYLFQKLVRTGFGSNNVDHCTRLCHASSVAALMEGINSGAVSNPVRDVAKAEVIFVIGANPTVNHPVAATFMKNAAKARRQADRRRSAPQRSGPARHLLSPVQSRYRRRAAQRDAARHRRRGPGRRGVHPRSHVGLRSARRERQEASRRKRWRRSAASTPQTIREVARLYATSKASIIMWGMGISQHVHGTDNARCLIALALSTGQIGKPGSGLHPLRGQNNVQGASDSGLIPMFYPDYQRVGSAGGAAALRDAVGHGARSGSGPDRGRDHERRQEARRFAACT